MESRNATRKAVNCVTRHQLDKRRNQIKQTNLIKGLKKDSMSSKQSIMLPASEAGAQHEPRFVEVTALPKLMRRVLALMHT